MNDFQYPEDKLFFMNLFGCGDETDFDKQFGQLFDFRTPSLKRKEFNPKRNAIYNKLLESGSECQLQLVENCSASGKFDVDHMIPLSSNELNKNIRHLKAEKSKKVLTQSFGSNHSDNFLLACKECNAFKKHRIGDFLKDILRNRVW